MGCDTQLGCLRFVTWVAEEKTYLICNIPKPCFLKIPPINISIYAWKNLQKLCQLCGIKEKDEEKEK